VLHRGARPGDRGRGRNSLYGRPADPRWEHLPAGDPEPDWSAVDPARLICHWLTDAAGSPVTGPGRQMVCDRRPGHLMTAAGFTDAVAELIPGPGARPATGGFEPGDTPRRIDGISVRHLTPAACDTPGGPDIDALSDHRPVLAGITLTAP
jgi:hypothetical protein